MRNQQTPTPPHPLQTLIEKAAVFVDESYNKSYARLIEWTWLVFLHYAEA